MADKKDKKIKKKKKKKKKKAVRKDLTIVHEPRDGMPRS